MFAAAHDRPDVVKLLLERGADVAVDLEGDWTSRRWSA